MKTKDFDLRRLFSIWTLRSDVSVSCDKTQQKHLAELAYLSRSLRLGKGWDLIFFHKRPGVRSNVVQGNQRWMLLPLGSMWKKTSKSKFVYSINQWAAHSGLSSSAYLTSPLSMAPSRLLPIAWVLSQDGCWILNVPAGLEPEKHLRKTSFCFLPRLCSTVARSCSAQWV